MRSLQEVAIPRGKGAAGYERAARGRYTPEKSQGGV